MLYEYESGNRSTSITQMANETVRAKGFPQRVGMPIPHLNTPEVRAKVRHTKTGRPVPLLQGKNHWNWKGGVDKGFWFTPEYKQWRREVFTRDGYKCVACGDARGGNLEADHIVPRSVRPDLIHEIENGRTLCHSCHRKTWSYGGEPWMPIYLIGLAMLKRI